MPKLGTKKDLLHCSFCGKAKHQVLKLIAGPGVYICDDCVSLCNDIIEQEVGERGPRSHPSDDEITEAVRAVNTAVSRLQTLALRRHTEPERPDDD